MYSQFSLTELLMTLTDEIAYLNARLAPCFNCSLVYQAGRKYFKTSVGAQSTVFVQVSQQILGTSFVLNMLLGTRNTTTKKSKYLDSAGWEPYIPVRKT